MEKSKGFIAEFKAFLMRGNVIDLAVGIIIGAAFKAIVDSLVANIIMPVISLLTNGIDFTNLFEVIGDGKFGRGDFSTLELAQKAGVATLNYGLLISAIINFIIIGFVIFIIVKGMNKLAEKRKKGEPEAAPTTKECPYCKSEINIEATKCPNCTSDV